MTLEFNSSPPKPIIIVGGGPVGLAAALELTRFNIPVVLIEQHKGVAWHPKTRNFNTRTMEIASHWGADVYHRLRAIDTPPGWKSPIRFFDHVSGTQMGQIESRGFEGPGPDISPAEPIMSSQDLLEKILLDKALATGLVDVRFDQRCVTVVRGAEEDADGVTVRVENRATGETYELEGTALVAADGYSSPIREQLGIKRTGSQDMNHFINTYFHADIEPHIQERKGVLLFVQTDKVGGVLQPLDAQGRWLCQIRVGKDKWNKETWTPEKCAWWVREATGIPDLKVDVRSVGMWSMNATTADEFVRGRVMLVGDAAHQFPPTGGLGVNTGLQGMHNLMWKLAYCAKGLAGWKLIETYDAERRTPSAETVAQSMQNSANVMRINHAWHGKLPVDTDTVIRESRRYGNHLGVEFGVHYKSSAVVSDGTAPPHVDDDYSDYVQSATPGCRAPHLWLGKHRALSIVHLWSSGFTIFATTGEAGAAWREAATKATAVHNVPIGVYLVGEPGIEDVDQHFHARYDIERTGAVLVRPDGVVAFRAKRLPGDVIMELTVAIRQVLHV
ncbi:hypothetical protein CC85DRAFT_284202 [Cutaneotrichosporon oleaginosum]|uniref:FAD-binding domain-containing protein n=1 Tax=Cutaneotrichosporon oleaginosum TaxID=879819 RepID=A0A0J0XRJ7_9TREE|nr:uncharacterized protein CC85DRAFT_284202 [Cutaneotrichosporon oleaginosum]KLT43692.1 hypothetical protein CC85DRAFT_284202 [Cutaneotrichosporon oleaginosum]TXT05111.1 hypothetical protein COLE_06431 [Cutaneotrichosporon oleaginosum]